MSEQGVKGIKMGLQLKTINRAFAEEILQWKYEAPYDLYNSDSSPEALRELLEGGYSIIADDAGELVGFFCSGRAAQVPAGREFGAYEAGCIDIGLGMRPELTGKGKGKEFLSFVISSIQKKYEAMPMRLTVAAFNLRAVRLYENLGFVKRNVFNRGDLEFIVMVKK
ncbi:GNAT family N-acetyltransferase [Peribacillus sp. SCS-37]|uniref:GNAT family N-acetyltransferase n=1 Tax=Paraperibacillus esterisolvens TaxID=3115296 RepID=UPI0039060698